MLGEEILKTPKVLHTTPSSPTHQHSQINSSFLPYNPSIIQFNTKRSTMAPSHPSIQSFYTKQPRGEKEVKPASLPKTGDGFTEEELADTLDPLSRKWNPEREYEEYPIHQLIPGPRSVTFAGRIVYINSATGRSQTQPKASGWHNLIIKDDSAAISVRSFACLDILSLLLTPAAFNPDQTLLRKQAIPSQTRPTHHRLDGIHLRCRQSLHRYRSWHQPLRQSLPRSSNFRPHHGPHDL